MIPAADAPAAAPISAWRRQTAAGALLTAVALGLQHVFEPEREEQGVVVVVPGGDEPDAWGGRLHLSRDGHGLYVLPSEIHLEN